MTIQSIAKQANSDLKVKGVKPVWFFKSEAVQYGLAVVDGKPWFFTVDPCKKELRGKKGMPFFPCPTPKLARGLAKAKAQLGL